jgi:ssRNA-specific RNase YbeY (16S rRNA maturation enzyme)
MRSLGFVTVAARKGRNTMTRKRRARAAPRRRASPAVDIVVASPLWTTKRSVKALLRRAIGQAALLTSTAVGELSIVLTDDAAIRALNRDWRCKDRTTNVLSFRTTQATRAHGTPRLLGDIVIAYETTEREARAENKPFAHHAAILRCMDSCISPATLTWPRTRRPRWRGLKRRSLPASTFPTHTLRAAPSSLYA